MEYLGFWVTCDNIPLNKKEVIKNTTTATTWKRVHKFIGLVNYHIKICTRLSHMLEKLTYLTSSKVKFNLTEAKQKSFKNIIQTVSCNNLLTYTDFKKRFVINTDRIQDSLRNKSSV